MDLLTLKDRTGRTWKQLSSATGIPEGNLHKIAHGKRGWDVETGWKLKALGVDLNAQAEVLARERGWPPQEQDRVPAEAA
jgi:hypothetical protein